MTPIPDTTFSISLLALPSHLPNNEYFPRLSIAVLNSNSIFLLINSTFHNRSSIRYCQLCNVCRGVKPVSERHEQFVLLALFILLLFGFPFSNLKTAIVVFCIDGPQSSPYTEQDKLLPGNLELVISNNSNTDGITVCFSIRQHPMFACKGNLFYKHSSSCEKKRQYVF